MSKEAESISILSLEELKIGETVYKQQLREIYDTYIILTQVENTDNGLMGKIGFIGTEITDEASKLRSSTIPITCVYNESQELDDRFVYED